MNCFVSKKVQLVFSVVIYARADSMRFHVLLVVLVPQNKVLSGEGSMEKIVKTCPKITMRWTKLG